MRKRKGEERKDTNLAAAAPSFIYLRLRFPPSARHSTRHATTTLGSPNCSSVILLLRWKLDVNEAGLIRAEPAGTLIGRLTQ